MSSRDQIQLELTKLTDRDGRTYYASFPDLPVGFKLDEILFFVFVSESGEENLVIKKKEDKRDQRDRPYAGPGGGDRRPYQPAEGERARWGDKDPPR